MKLTLLLCGAALLVAGCSSPQNPFASSGDFSYAYDLVPSPVPDLTPVDLDRIYKLPPPGAVVMPAGFVNPSSGGPGYISR